MIFGIGTDIVNIERIQQGLSRYGERFARRILADAEMREFAVSGRQANFLAKRFAAKEAVSKALGTGFRDGLALRHISVGHDDKGRPEIVCEGRALELMSELGITQCHVSLSDEIKYAIAFVTLESS